MTKNSFKLQGFAVSFLLLAAACGSNDTAPRNEAPPVASESPALVSTEFDCVASWNKCKTGKEYCLGSRRFNSPDKPESYFTKECLAIPEGCENDCACLVRNAKEHFPTSNNCSGLVACSSADGILKVTCLFHF